MTLEEHLDEYIKLGCPMNASGYSKPYHTDESYSFVLYRKGRFQVEVYTLVRSYNPIGKHAHPNMYTCFFDPETGMRDKVIYNTQTHGLGENKRPNNMMLFVAQLWDEGVEMTSASIQWLGHTAGPIHDQAIRQHYPNAIVKEGFADVRLG